MEQLNYYSSIIKVDIDARMELCFCMMLLIKTKQNV